jgi:hypothetical protein
MSLIRTKCTEYETFQSFELESINENTNPIVLKRFLRQERPSTPAKSSLAMYQKSDLFQFSFILKNLKKREGFVQKDNLQQARNLKEQLINPKQLKDEYDKLIERYKNVRFRDTMRPRKIPRSGINICVDDKKKKYEIVTPDLYIYS